MKNTLAVGIALKLHIKVFYNHKRGCVFPMVIWPAFRMGQYRVNDHPYHAPQFIGPLMLDIALTYRSKYRFGGYAMPEVIITAE